MTTENKRVRGRKRYHIISLDLLDNSIPTRLMNEQDIPPKKNPRAQKIHYDDKRLWFHTPVEVEGEFDRFFRILKRYATTVPVNAVWFVVGPGMFGEIEDWFNKIMVFRKNFPIVVVGMGEGLFEGWEGIVEGYDGVEMFRLCDENDEMFVEELKKLLDVTAVALKEFQEKGFGLLKENLGISTVDVPMKSGIINNTSVVGEKRVNYSILKDELAKFHGSHLDDLEKYIAQYSDDDDEQMEMLTAFLRVAFVECWDYFNKNMSDFGPSIFTDIDTVLHSKLFEKYNQLYPAVEFGDIMGEVMNFGFLFCWKCSTLSPPATVYFADSETSFDKDLHQNLGHADTDTVFTTYLPGLRCGDGILKKALIY